MNTFKIAGGMLCLPLMLAGCGGDDDPAPAAVAPMTAEQACVALRGLSIPATAIGLPSRGAKVVTADLQAPAGTGVAATPEHCKVIVRVESVDPTAPGVTAQVNLPTTWNRKAVQYGGGGLNGVSSQPPPTRRAHPPNRCPWPPDTPRLAVTGDTRSRTRPIPKARPAHS